MRRFRAIRLSIALAMLALTARGYCSDPPPAASPDEPADRTALVREYMEDLARRDRARRELLSDPEGWIERRLESRLVPLLATLDDLTSRTAALQKRAEAEKAEREKALADLKAESAKAREELAKKLEEAGKKTDAEKAAREKAIADLTAERKKAEDELKKRMDDQDRRERDRLKAHQREIDRLKELTLTDLGAATFDGIEFVRVPAGSFRMGITPEEIESLRAINRWKDVNDCEAPAHEVRITQPLLISRTEVTQAQWKSVMGGKDNPSAFKDDARPVENVNYHDVHKFLKKLGERTGQSYRLPSEAEWEYACRFGGRGLFGAAADGAEITMDNIAEHAWFSGNTNNKTEPVGKKKPNAAGLHDMHGNVWEWCRDWFDPEYYGKSGPADPVNGEKATEKVFRGGAWVLDAPDLRATIRGGNLPDFKSPYVGFRIVREWAAR